MKTSNLFIVLKKWLNKSHMSFKFNDSNYSEYKKIFEIFWKHHRQYFPSEMPESISPVNVLNEFEKKSMPIARRSLIAGLQDMLSQRDAYPADLLKKIEVELAKNNLPSIQMLVSELNNTQ
jgi:hypothetical protein